MIPLNSNSFGPLRSTPLRSQVKNSLPYNDYFEYYGPDYRLHMPVSNMENLNSQDYLERTKIQLLEILSNIEPVPSVQIETGQTGTNISPVAAAVEKAGGDDVEMSAEVRAEVEDKKQAGDMVLN
tara:strand:- start:185 stop:559 length:375 start_codon:yes stop_codon:yes gene_type:complete